MHLLSAGPGIAGVLQKLLELRHQLIAEVVDSHYLVLGHGQHLADPDDPGVLRQHGYGLAGVAVRPLTQQTLELHSSVEPGVIADFSLEFKADFGVVANGIRNLLENFGQCRAATSALDVDAEFGHMASLGLVATMARYG